MAPKLRNRTQVKPELIVADGRARGDDFGEQNTCHLVSEDL